MRLQKRYIHYLRPDILRVYMPVFFVLALGLTAFQILLNKNTAFHIIKGEIIDLPKLENHDIICFGGPILQVILTEEGRLFVNLDDIPVDEEGKMRNDRNINSWKINFSSPYKVRNLGDKEISLQSLDELVRTTCASSKLDVLLIADNSTPYSVFKKVTACLRKHKSSILLQGY